MYHSMHSSPFCWEGLASYQIFKKGGLTGSQFLRGVARKEEVMVYSLGERSTAKNYRPVSLLVVSKVFDKLVNNRIVDHSEKCGLFSDLQYGFRSSGSTTDLPTVVSDRIARVFNMSGATRAVAPDISKAFDRIFHAGLLHKLKS